MKKLNLTLSLEGYELNDSQMKKVLGGKGSCTVQTPAGDVGGISEAEAKASGYPYECSSDSNPR